MTFDPNDPESSSFGGDATVDLLDQILEQLQSGANPDIEQLIAAHPDRADDIRQLVSVVRLVHDATQEENPVADLDARVNVGAKRPVLDDFRIEREIGRGGMGIVYEATQLSLQRRVALKVLLPGVSISRQALERFNREAKTAGALHHTHIVPVYTVGENEGVHYYAMQFIEGRSLAAFLRQCKQSNFKFDDIYFRRVARWGQQMADALDYAHERGVIHRDIKPANIMRDKEDNIWLTDFGLARDDSAESITLTEDIVGTARYMAPEQARGGRATIDATVDIYALGVTLYELVTLQPPFDGPDRETILRRIVNEPPRAPRKLNPAAPRELETIILKALEKEPGRRYLCASLMGEDLRRFQIGEPLLAQRPSVWENARRFVRRHRLLTTLTMSLILLLSGFSGWMWSLYSRLDSQVRAVDRAEQKAAHESESAKIASEYLARMIASLDPHVAADDGKSIVDARAAGEMLRSAQNDIAQQFADRPLTQASLYIALGAVARARWWIPEAVEAHSRALELRRGALSADDPELADALIELADTLNAANRYAEAAELLREALAMRRRLFPNNAEMLYATLLKVAAGVVVEDAEFALTCAQEAADIATQRFGSNSAQYLEAIRVLSWVKTAQGQCAEAEELLDTCITPQLRESSPDMYAGCLARRGLIRSMCDKSAGAAEDYWAAYESYRRCGSTCDSQAAGVVEALANIAIKQNDAGAAEQYLAEAMSLRRRVSGDECAEVAQDLALLANIRDQRGDVDGAHTAQLDALRRFERIYGAFAPTANSLRIAIIDRLIRNERFAEALVVAREQVKIFREHLEPPLLTSALRKVGSILDSLGDDAGAEAALAEALAVQREHASENRLELASTIVLLGRSVRSPERAVEAERLFREAIAIQRDMEPPPHKWLSNTLIDLAWTLRLKGDYEAAAEAGEEGLELVRAAHPGDPVALGKALVVVASNFIEMGRAADAEPLLLECVALRREKLHDHWMTASAESHLGECLTLLGRFNEAEPLLLRAYPTLREKFGRRHEFVVQTLERIARLYELSGRPYQAAEWRKELQETHSPEGSGQ